MADDVSSRILTAATLAEQAANLVRVMSNLQHWTELRNTRFEPYLYQSQRNLIAASGPSHWGAVAELLRAVVAAHRGLEGDGWHYCQSGGSKYGGTDYDSARPCPTVAALLPLVDQIIRDLGDGQ